MNNTLAGLRKPIAAGAVALTVLAGSIGVASFAFAQEDATSTPTVEQTAPTVEPTAQTDDGAVDEGTVDDGSAGTDKDGGTTDDGTTDGSGRPECDEDKLPSDGTSPDTTADTAGLTF
jgi:hypothetical protein